MYEGLGERAVHPVGAEAMENAKRVAREAAAAQQRLEEKRRVVYGLAADLVVAVSGAVVMLAAQSLWMGEPLLFLAYGAAALAGWIAAGIVRDA